MQLPADAVRTRLQPGEELEDSPHPSLFLAQRRCFVAKLDPVKRHTTVADFEYAHISQIRVEAGSELRAKKKRYWVEIGTSGQPARGMGTGYESEHRFSNGQGNFLSAQVDFMARPNVIGCGQGPAGLSGAEEIVSVLEAKRADARSQPTSKRGSVREDIDDPVERLVRLAALLDGGYLTRGEFDDQKARILASL